MAIQRNHMASEDLIGINQRVSNLSGTPGYEDYVTAKILRHLYISKLKNCTV